MRVAGSKLVLVVFLLFAAFAVQAQMLKPIDSLSSKISLYGIKNQSPVLFIHFDKNVYSNNDNVWFTAYLLNCSDYSSYKTLALALVRDYDRKVVMQDKFVIKNGLAFGNTFVPDSVGPGNYSFIAYSNRLVNTHLDIVFTQPITIKAEDKGAIVASLDPIDTSASADEKKVRLVVNFPGMADQPSAVPATYYVGSPMKVVSKGVITTKKGQYEFDIPADLLTPGNNRLHVQVRYKNEVKDVSMELPLPPQPATVLFYPEGGNLVNNQQSIIGWEVKTAAGTSLSVNAFLYEDKKIIDTLTTNGYGLGKFKLKPKAGSNYYVKLSGVNKQNTLYSLPVALTGGVVMSLQKAIVNDTLTVTLKDERHEKLYLTVHNYKKLFLTMPVIMSGANKTMSIKLDAVPKGLTQLTLTDSLNRPFAERIFFAHHNRKATLTIAPDKSEYATRQKVNVKIKLDGKPDSGFVSIACVQESRVEIKKQNDVVSYVYLKHDLEDIPVKENYLGNNEADKQYLENILLVKGWRRYTWTDMLKTQPADTVRTIDNITFKGSVTWYDERLRKPVSIINLNKPSKIITTGPTGNFMLSDSDLVTAPDKKVNFAINEKHPGSNYHIYLFDPYKELNSMLAWRLTPTDYSIGALENTQYMQLAVNEHAIHLKEVNIKAKKEAFHGNECGDYVCRFDILNCPNHRGESDNRLPVVGEKYEFNGRIIAYPGCGGISEHQFAGVYDAVEFYPADYSKVMPSAPDYLSTLYWKHQLKISSAKDTEFSFYTGDITGPFKIIVQGVTGNDVVYGEKTFNVVKSP